MNATEQKVTDYMKTKGLDVRECSLLTKWENARSLTFKFAVKPRDLERIREPSLWPHGVSVRRFINFRRRDVVENDVFGPGNGVFSGRHQPARIGHQNRNTYMQPVFTEPMELSNRFVIDGMRLESVSDSIH